METGVVIIGAGEAGARAAVTLRDRGFAGPITLIGRESHFPYERPPLSKAVITAPLLPEAPAAILDHRKLAEYAVTFIANAHAEAIDRARRTIVLNGAREIGYAKLLLATGASPRRLNVEGGWGDGVLYLRTLSDALTLRGRLQPSSEIVVVGGGFIGLEIAASAVARGCAVTLVETASRLLMRGVPEAVAERIAARHRAAGVMVLTSVTIDAILQRGGRQVVRLEDGSVLTADLVVIGVGAIPETRLATTCGLAVDNGIRVDAFLQTDDPNIFAAGDCCSFPHGLYGGRRVRLEAWRNAQDQGAAAAANMLGAQTPYDAVPWFWSDQYDETLQVAGLFDPSCTTVKRNLGETASMFFHLDPESRLVAASAVGPNAAIAREIRMAEMLIARRAHPEPCDLGNPSFKLKDLLGRVCCGQ